MLPDDRQVSFEYIHRLANPVGQCILEQLRAAGAIMDIFSRPVVSDFGEGPNHGDAGDLCIVVDFDNPLQLLEFK